MSANLDRRESGEAAVLLVGEPAWHREGTVVPRGHPAERDLALALELAGLDFEVEKRRHYIHIEDTGPNGLKAFQSKVSRKAWSVVRKDRMEVIGTVGDIWHPLQNRDAFACLEPALDAGLATIETAGSLEDGARVWMMAKVDADEVVRRVFDIEPGEVPDLEALFGEVLPFALFFNDHSGSSKARIKETGVRVVCRNTLDWSLGKDEGFAVEVEHTTNVEENYKLATDLLFKNLVERFRALATYRETFRQTYLPERAFQRFVLDVAVPVKQLEEKIRRRDGTAHTETALEKATARRLRIRKLWEEGDGHTGNHTAWEAWNGVIQWLDHGNPDHPEGPNFRGSRVNSLNRGSLGKVKSTTFRRLLDYARSPEDERALMLSN